MEAYEKGDYKAALREWTPLAEHGYKEAQFNLGVMYENGQGVAEDHKTGGRSGTHARPNKSLPLPSTIWV